MAKKEPVEAISYVLRVYDTETKADTGKDSEALYVTSSTNPTIDNSHKINDVYTINRKYYYRIESNEPVSGIEIDALVFGQPHKRPASEYVKEPAEAMEALRELGIGPSDYDKLVLDIEGPSWLRQTSWRRDL